MSLADTGRATARAATPHAAFSHPDVAVQAEEIADAAALEALAPEWAELFAADPEASPFQSPAWLLPWTRAFLRGGGVSALAVRRGGELVGLAPLFIHVDPQSGRRQLTLLGNGLSDRQALLALPHARCEVSSVVAQALAERRERWDMADFRDLPDGSPLLTLPLDAGATSRIEPEAPCPVLALPGDPAAVSAGLPKSRRADLRRCERRLAELGPLTFTRADADGRRELLDALARLHAARWRARGEAGVLAEAAVRAFHEEATVQLFTAGLLRLEALRLGERIIAVHYGLRRGGVAYSYLHAFDPELAVHGPGWLLLARVLQAAVRDGAARFDFLRGREAYKYAWGGIDQPQWRRRIWR